MATATYPPPPPYYKLYKDFVQNPKSAPEPPPPIQGTYVLYGANYTTDDVLPSLEEQGCRQLYPKGPNVEAFSSEEFLAPPSFDSTSGGRKQLYPSVVEFGENSGDNFEEESAGSEDLISSAKVPPSTPQAVASFAPHSSYKDGLGEGGLRGCISPVSLIVFASGLPVVEDDFKKELRSLNRELQLHILELADVLVERPSQYARRVEDISLIFRNLHHLLNSLRPHQARATLIHILELQIQRRKQAVEDIKNIYIRAALQNRKMNGQRGIRALQQQLGYKMVIGRSGFSLVLSTINKITYYHHCYGHIITAESSFPDYTESSESSESLLSGSSVFGTASGTSGFAAGAGAGFLRAFSSASSSCSTTSTCMRAQKEMQNKLDYNKCSDQTMQPFTE
ncbi:hypothetical protein HHK36_017505 [Tetracentron sinense]|uniref:Mediator of RNA polymerase II transcription subunit 7 n=1 Tax=Tetracentron sinense TaxID=13715 RepID=A0A834YYZ9_TETSI|nr:hypothetical protein HHK36_017505 [Tetracentron sinense]